jgi:carboxyl-terminal processing protease
MSGGVGLAVVKTNGTIVVESVHEQCTCQDIVAGDKIVRVWIKQGGVLIAQVGKEFVASRSVEEVRAMLRGEPGSTVEVTLERLNKQIRAPLTVWPNPLELTAKAI